MQIRNAFTLINILISLLTGSINTYSSNADGFRDVTALDGNFIAVGTAGRIDLITKTGNVTHLTSNSSNILNSVAFSNGKVVVVGEKGTVLVSDDKKVFKKTDSGIDENINCVTAFNNLFVAVADNGIILVGNEANQWDGTKLPVKGDVVSVSANNSSCFAVTNKGEIISSKDAVNWKIFNYNMEYKGFAEPCIFKDVLVTKNWITIAGYHEDNTPISLFSSKGTVWTERYLDYIDNEGIPQFFTGIPNDNAYDPLSDEFFIVCDNGSISVLPSCHKCNKALTISHKNLRAISYSDNILMIVGDDYYINAIKTDSLIW